MRLHYPTVDLISAIKHYRKPNSNAHNRNNCAILQVKQYKN